MQFKFAVAITGFALASSTHGATTIGFTDLPSDIQSCVTSGTCSVSTVGDIAPGVTLLNYANNAYSSEPFGGLHYLIRYSLSAPSNQSYYAYDYSTGSYFTNNSPITGFAWLDAPLVSNSGSPINFSLFFDKTSFIPNRLDFAVDYSAALLGSAYNNYSYPNVTETMHPLPWGGMLPVICPEPECYGSAKFNFLNFFYEQYGGFAFWKPLPEDSRHLLFEEISGFGGTSYGLPDYERTTSFYVNAVPVPASVWLLASGILGISSLARRKQA